MLGLIRYNEQLENFVNFLFIGKSNQNNNLWKNMLIQFQKKSRLYAILQGLFCKHLSTELV